MSSFASAEDVSRWREDEFLAGIAQGRFIPFTLPLFVFGWFILLVHMMIPQLQSLATRFFTFTLVATFNLWLILKCRSPSSATAVALGMLSTWNVLWAFVLLVINDAKKDFKRITFASNTSRKANGYHKDSNHGDVKLNKGPAAYRWQSFPEHDFFQRLGWSVDLLTSFRGVNWNWKISGLPSRPPLVEASIHGVALSEAAKTDAPSSRTGRSRPGSTGEVLRRNFTAWIVGSLVLDVLKFVANKDPYFWGDFDAPAPAWMGPIFQESVVLTRIYRQWLAFVFNNMGLYSFFGLVAMVLCGVLGTPLVGVAAEPWVYPDQFGTYVSVLDRGLAGFWGGWWHQIFRYGFQSSAQFITGKILRLSKKSPVAVLLQLVFSFYLSGLMHACISLSMISDQPQKPWTEMFWFFALQPLGIIVGLAWSQLLKVLKISKKMPRWMGWVGNFVYTNAWLYMTLPLLTNDLIRGGMLLYEPNPISIINGLGLGGPNEKFFRWGDAPFSFKFGQSPWYVNGLRL